MVQLGEKFLYGFEIGGAVLIGLIFVIMAITAESGDMAWNLIIAAVLCFCCALFFGLMYVTNVREREKRKLR